MPSAGKPRKLTTIQALVTSSSGIPHIRSSPASHEQTYGGNAMFRTFMVSVAAIAISTGAFAQQRQFGSAAEAKAMEERVIIELKADETAALAKFNKADGGFRDRDLYVFCFNTTTGLFNAHVFPALMGTDNRLLKEKDGSPLGQKIFDAVNAAKEGTTVTVSYNFPKPNTTEPVPKESYVARVGNTACGVGYYK
jgi:cytochrome c